MTTHRHWDHWQALAQVQSATGAVVVAHPDDAEELPVAPTELVSDGDQVPVGDDQPLRHPPARPHPGQHRAVLRRGAATLADTPHLFTGDSLFPGGPGNTEGDPARFGALIDDLEERVFGALPDGTWVYPGHGKDTTLGAERPHVAEWRDRGW